MNLSSAVSHVRAGATGRDEHLSDLAVPVRVFLVGVMVVGVVVVAFAASTIRIDRPGLLVLMATLALLTSTVKLTLPLSRGVSTLSVSNAITFAAMLLLDGGSAVAIVVVSAWGQCTFRMRSRNPLHRTLFSMATLGIAAFAAAQTLDVIVSAVPVAGQSRSGALAALNLMQLLRGAIPSALGALLRQHVPRRDRRGLDQPPARASRVAQGVSLERAGVFRRRRRRLPRPGR